MNRLEILKRILTLRSKGHSPESVYHDIQGAMQQLRPDGDYDLIITDGNPEQLLKERYADKNIPAIIVYKGEINYRFPLLYHGIIVIFRKIHQVRLNRSG